MAAIKAKLDALKVADAPQSGDKYEHFPFSCTIMLTFHRQVSRPQALPRPTQNRGPSKKNKWTKFDLRAGAKEEPKVIGTK
jgi:hypothetical protein